MSIIRQPLAPTPLCLNDELMLKCIVQMIPEIDTPVTIESGWMGHSSLSDVQRVNVSELYEVQSTYLSMAMFSALQSNDTGSYTCWAYTRPDGSNSIVQQSPQSSDTIAIRVGESSEGGGNIFVCLSVCLSLALSV